MGKNFIKLGVFEPKNMPEIIKLFKDSIRKGTAPISLLELGIKNKKGDIKYGSKKHRDIADDRRLTRQTIQDYREYAESIINTVREPLIVLDGDLRVVSASRSFYEFFKVKPEETEGQFIYDLGNRQWNIPELRRLLNKIIPKNESFDDFRIEHDFRTIGKKVMLLNARRIPQPPEKPKIILLAIDDITDKEESDKFKLLFESNIDAIFIADVKTRMLVDCNKNAEKLIGRSREEILSMTANALHPSDEVKETMEAFKRQAEGKIEYVETEVLAKSGQRIPVEINSAPFVFKGKSYLMGIFRNITERKKMEVEMRENEESYREVVNSITDIFFAMDKDLRYTYWNKASEKLTGISAKDAIGKPIFKIFPDNEETKRATKVYQEILKTQHSKTFLNEYNLRGKKYIFEISGYPTRNGLSVFVKDISERKKAEGELKKLSQELKSKVDELERFGKLSVGRELKMVELKKKISELENQLKENALLTNRVDI